MQAGAFSHSANFSVWEESKQQPCVQHRTRHHSRKSEVARAWYNLSRRRCHTRRLVAAATAAAATSTAGQPTGRVFRATCPLEGWEPIEAVLRERFPAALALHHYVLVEALRSSSSGCGDSSGTSSSAGDSLVVAFDFLPSDPTSHFTAATLLRGGAVQGTTRCRPLRGVPRQRCQLQGLTWLPDPHAAAAAFQQQYDCRLQLLRNDCTHHTDQLIAYLLAGSGGEGGRSRR